VLRGFAFIVRVAPAFSVCRNLPLDIGHKFVVVAFHQSYERHHGNVRGDGQEDDIRACHPGNPLALFNRPIRGEIV
jgi:hypothetical protein